jgi:hypothetical protein
LVAVVKSIGLFELALTFVCVVEVVILYGVPTRTGVQYSVGECRVVAREVECRVDVSR